MADTSYIIDVAANMPDAGVTTAQLDDLSQSLISAGASAESLEAATLHVGAQLRAAGEATKAANAALADGKARYGEVERAAIRAAKATESAALKGRLTPELARTAHEAAKALDSESAALGKLEARASAAARAEAKLLATHGNLKKISSAAAGAFNEQAAAAKKSVREAEGMVPLVKKYNDLGDALSTSSGQMILATGAAVGVAAAVVAITAAAVAGTLAVAAWGVSLGDARREAAITEEAVAALHPEIGALGGTFASITEETGVGAAALRGFKKQLDAARVSAADMPDALRAMAMGEVALGQGGSAEFLERLKETKGAARDVAREMNAKLGGVVEKRMMGLGAQGAKLKKNISDLFGGLNIDPVLAGFRVLVDLFDENTAAGEGMRWAFETIFQPIIDQAQNAAYAVEAFVLGFMIGLTKVYIALKPAIKAVSEFFGFEDTSLSDVLSLVTDAGEIAAYAFVAFAVVVGALAAALGVAVAAAVAIQVAVYAMAAAVMYAGFKIVEGVIGAWNAVTDYLGSLSLAEIGSMLIRGLAAGITGGASEVLGAVVSVAKGAITAAKNALGIKSPSKPFTAIGGFTAEGMAIGLDDGAADVQASMAALVEPPAPGSYTALGRAAADDAAEGARTGARTGGKRAAASTGEGAVNIYGDLYFGGAKASAAEKANLAEELTRLLQGDAAAMAGEAAA